MNQTDLTVGQDTRLKLLTSQSVFESERFAEITFTACCVAEDTVNLETRLIVRRLRS